MLKSLQRLCFHFMHKVHFIELAFQGPWTSRVQGKVAFLKEVNYFLATIIGDVVMTFVFPTCTLNPHSSSDKSSSSPRHQPIKRLRLRGDWSDTGPDARPENERDTNIQEPGIKLSIKRTPALLNPFPTEFPTFDL